MHGRNLMSITREQITHLFMLLHLFFTQIVVRSISRHFGRKSGRKRYFQRFNGSGKHIENQRNLLPLFRQYRTISCHKMSIRNLMITIELWTSLIKRLLDQQAKTNMMTTALKYRMKLKFLHFSGGLKNNK